jgi:hypothetical protein
LIGRDPHPTASKKAAATNSADTVNSFGSILRTSFRIILPRPRGRNPERDHGAV